jgi:hypothetical protein
MNKKKVAIIASCLIFLAISASIVTKTIYDRAKANEKARNNQNNETVDNLKDLNDGKNSNLDQNKTNNEGTTVTNDQNSVNDTKTTPVINNAVKPVVTVPTVKVPEVTNNAPNTVISYQTPVAIFSKYLDLVKKTTNTTSAVIIGDYTIASYVISSSNVYSGITENWNNYVSGQTITLTNLSGLKYVWVKVIGKNGNTYVYGTSMFDMVKEPAVLFSKNGDNTYSMTNSTSGTISGDFVKAQYTVSTSDTINCVTESWSTYISGHTINLSNLSGTYYVWIKVLSPFNEKFT